MSNDKHLKRIRHRQPNHGDGVHLHHDTFVALLHDRVVKRFVRIVDLNVLAIPLNLPGLQENENQLPYPSHPACAEFSGTGYCRESWQLHLAELKRRPEVHWHKCDHQRLCALVPLICNGQCPAVFKLVCSDAIGENHFKRYIELLDVLVENLVTSEADFLAMLFPPGQSAAGYEVHSSRKTNQPVKMPPSHPQVVKALEYIEDHFCNPKLTVGYVAQALDIHPDYLAHLFNEQVGQRMSRYIAEHRIEHAKHLLSTTDWQIKRIAHETGHANRNWFSHVFSSHTGLTPSEYRKKTRIQPQTVSDRLGKASQLVLRPAM
ncbi:MAG: helix-turn-helix transcriptional regulator [Planctomycetota bacterium]